MMSVSIVLLRAGSAVIRRTDCHSDPLPKTYVADRLYPALRAAKKMAGSRELSPNFGDGRGQAAAA